MMLANCPKIRVARATNLLEQISAMYIAGLELEVLSSFQDHAGYDGIILGYQGAPYHFEFTSLRGENAPRSNSHEDLIVLYIADRKDWSTRVGSMERAGFARVKSANIYWDHNGATFEDPEGFRVVICNQPGI